MNIETLIFAYLAVCISMILFNIVCIFVFGRREKKLERKSYHFEEQVREQFMKVANGGHIDSGHKKYLVQKMNRIGNLIAFDETLNRLGKDDSENLSLYLEEVYPVFIQLSRRYQKKNELKEAYFPYLIQKYGIVKNKRDRIINNMLLDMVKKPSLYCRENALKALYTTGDVECVMMAIRILDRSRVYHSPKLLTDGLLSFAGNHEELTAKIWETLGEYSVEMKVTLLNYIRFQSGAYCQQMLSFLKDEGENEEVHFACIRYLGKYPYEDAYELLIDFVNHETEYPWQYAAIAAKVLAAYPREETILALKERLHSHNWYVRLNASESLEHLGLSYMDLIDVFEGDDRYAREILCYRFDMRKIREKEAKAQ